MRGRAPGRVEPKVIRHYVAAREAGRPVTGPDRRPRMIDKFLPKMAEWVERFKGRARADVIPGGLVGLRLTGVERTTRRALVAGRPGGRPAGAGPGWDAAADVAVPRQAGLVQGPGSDPGVGPDHSEPDRLPGCHPTPDRRSPHSRAHRQSPHRHRGPRRRSPVRRPQNVSSKWPGTTAPGSRTCVPYDPESKGGKVATVKTVKADLVPT